jgi:hydroxymethylpyrimidine kinase/phosphomethylpyrimidine kinase
MIDVLICSGLDPSGGAGFIADTRVMAELGCRPAGIVTALTVQNTTGVVGVHPCDPEAIGHQLEYLLTDVEVKAAKIGMVGTVDVARSIASALQLSAAPVIWDPVLFPSRGDIPLIDVHPGEVITALRPHLTLVTPNKRELFLLTGMPTDTVTLAETAARELATRVEAAVLVKGGHFADDPDHSTDILIGASGSRDEIRGPRIAGGEHVHGTGCALASAIAAHCAHGRDLLEACTLAKHYVAALIANPVHPGRGAGAVR